MRAHHVVAASVAAFLGLLSASAEVKVGVDYYPEQWSIAAMDEDLDAIRNDLGCDIIRVAEFMWHSVEPEEGVYNFTLLDTIITKASSLGLEVMLGTPTAAVPAWMYRKYSAGGLFITPNDSPNGYRAKKSGFGGREQASLHSEVYVEASRRVVEALAERYGDLDAVTYWQVDNEISNLDFSPMAERAWHVWLAERYGGSIAALNEAYGAVFWSTTYDSFNQVPLPRFTFPGASSRSNEDFRSNMSPGLLLDYRRFRRDAIKDFIGMQVDILRAHGVKGNITTNAAGNFWKRAIDHNDLYELMDTASYDNYPVWGTASEAPQPYTVAMTLDTARGWMTRERPDILAGPARGWLAAEHLIGFQGNDILGYQPRPGEAVAWAAQSLLYGAQALMFFRYRTARSGQEEFCYGVLDHTAERGQGRKWQEAKQAFAIAKDYSHVWTTPINASVALVYDVENVFSWMAQPQSTAFDFTTEARRLYYPFWKHGATIDVVCTRAAFPVTITAEALLAKYRVLLLPAPMILSGANAALDGVEVVALLRRYVALGGVVWASFRSDIKDAASRINAFPSRLAELAGVRVVEIESLGDGTSVTLVSAARGSGTPTTSTGEVFREGLEAIDHVVGDGGLLHDSDSSSSSSSSSSLEVVWDYDDDFFGALNLHAVVKRTLGKGSVLYVGTGIDSASLGDEALEVLVQQGIPFVVGTTSTAKADGDDDGEDARSEYVEVQLRHDAAGNRYAVAINHANTTGRALGEAIGPYEVRVVGPTTVAP